MEPRFHNHRKNAGKLCHVNRSADEESMAVSCAVYFRRICSDIYELKALPAYQQVNDHIVSIFCVEFQYFCLLIDFEVQNAHLVFQKNVNSIDRPSA